MLREKMRWLYYTELIVDELAQAQAEGKNVPPEEVEAILDIADEKEREERARQWMLKTENLPLPDALEQDEPNTWEGIQAQLDSRAKAEHPVDRQGFPARLRAAWAGRMSGCLLGIPVEGWTREKIAALMEATGQDPRRTYFTSHLAPALREAFDIRDQDSHTPYDRQVYCWVNNMDAFPVDDDTNYSVAALRVLERYGRGFTADNIAENLLYAVPSLHACTAERLAYRNLLNCVPPPDCAWVLNPYREWIGAQIRADFFGYISPGRPNEAARMAFQDGSVTHVRNGIYAEMYVAALVSLAPCGLDGIAMIETAKTQIPPRSRLALALDALLSDLKAGAGYEALLDRLHARYQESQWFWWGHAIPNALLVSALLACFDSDHAQAIGHAVMAGFDTDCNAATVGSIVGFKTGRVEDHWLSHFPAVLRTSVHGYERLTLEELTGKTLTLTEFPMAILKKG